MPEATIFKNNKNQAVRIPKSLEFPEGVKKVRIISLGKARLIVSSDTSWDSWFEGESQATDFMDEREQPSDQERETL